MSAPGGDLIDLSDETAPSAASAGNSAQGRRGSIAADTDGQPLQRTTTRDSQVSTGGGKDNTGALSNLLSNTMTFFNRKRGSISAADTANYSNTPATTSLSALQNGSPTSSRVALSQPIVPNNSSSPQSSGPLSLPSQGAARSSADSLPQGAAIPRGASAIARPRGSTTSGGQSASNTSSYPYPSQPSASSSAVPTTSLGQSSTSSFDAPMASNTATQARLRTLPRLDSYKVEKQRAAGAGVGDSLSRIDSRDSEAGGDDGNDTTTSMSGTETEQETEGTETDDDDEDGEDDDEDDDHTEADVRGGLQRTLQRPALPTLNSTRGFSRAGAATPFQTPQAPAVYNGWTTFGTSTPTPGPLRTARPTPGDNAPNVSYFDARPSSGRKTPAQTPKALASDSPARSYRSPTAPRTPGAAISPHQRMRLESRTSGMPHNRQGSIPNSVPSPITSVTGQSIPASAIPSIPTTSQPASPSRPSFYHRQSRSLVDLSRSLDSEDLSSHAKTASEGTSTQAVSEMNAASDQPLPPAAAVAEGSGKDGAAALPSPATSPSAQPTVQPQVQENAAPKAVQRRQSMPEMRLDPPLYSIDDDFFVQYRKDIPMPVSREEEGREPLPVYSCDVHIEGYVPRKMEFLKPGVQAKDRRWKRQYLILHGTSIKIYKSDPRSKPVAGEEAPPSPGVHKADLKPDFGSNAAGKRAAVSSAAVSSSTRARSGTQASRMSASSGNSGLSSSTSTSAASINSEKIAPSTAAGKTVSAANARVFDPDVPVHVHVQDEDESTLATLQHPTHLISKAGDNRVVRHYTLQGAESGLAADYLKRRHVVRIRAEGEQFLVQAKDDRNVIDWIEALQAATNTALDLDVRPLPKFITLPRRRRRRPRPDGAAAPGATGTASATGATAAPAAATTASAAQRDRMNNMLAEDQENYLARPGGLVT